MRRDCKNWAGEGVEKRGDMTEIFRMVVRTE
jgi:hypothetical protein